MNLTVIRGSTKLISPNKCINEDTQIYNEIEPGTGVEIREKFLTGHNFTNLLKSVS